jgi:hypothetical protein
VEYKNTGTSKYGYSRKHHMQTSCNNIHMFCSIQTYKHIDTSSMKYHINHSMQFSCNDIHMFCSIQTHMHIHTSNIKTHLTHNIKHHHIKQCHTCFFVHKSFTFFISHHFGTCPEGFYDIFLHHTYHHEGLVPR